MGSGVIEDLRAVPDAQRPPTPRIAAVRPLHFHFRCPLRVGEGLSPVPAGCAGHSDCGTTPVACDQASTLGIDQPRLSARLAFSQPEPCTCDDLQGVESLCGSGEFLAAGWLAIRGRSPSSDVMIAAERLRDHLPGEGGYC